MSELRKINFDNINFNEDNIFLTLGLIRNDFSDLIRLQSLWVNSSEVEKAHQQEKEGEKITEEIGRMNGTDLYILRHGLSYLFNSLEFIRSIDIEECEELKEMVDELSPKYKKMGSLYKDVV